MRTALLDDVPIYCDEFSPSLTNKCAVLNSKKRGSCWITPLTKKAPIKRSVISDNNKNIKKIRYHNRQPKVNDECLPAYKIEKYDT